MFFFIWSVAYVSEGTKINSEALRFTLQLFASPLQLSVAKPFCFWYSIFDLHF